MAVVNELIREESDGSISFGNYELAAKSKQDDFKYQGDIYKVKTFNEITKLEKNGSFVYESVPGTTVLNLNITEDGMSFGVEGKDNAQITVGLEEEAEYGITVNGKDAGTIKTNLGGKLSLSAEFGTSHHVDVVIKKA